MKALNPNNLAFLTTFSALSTFAQSAELTPQLQLTASPERDMQAATTFIYENAASKYLPHGEAHLAQVSSLESAKKKLLNATTIHTNALSMTVPGTAIFSGNDHGSFRVYAPMQTVNGALSVVGYVSESRVDDSLVKLAQILSFAAKQQINAEIAYSLRVDRRSNFDSVITYRLNPASDSEKSGAAVSMRYSIKF
jgi:hypothetical protein